MTSRGGRKRDQTLDAAILDAAVNVLAEVGFDGMTMDAVAARAHAAKATMYRRWPSKVDLVLDVVERVNRPDVTIEQVPETGSLRGDLVALTNAFAFEGAEKKLKVMAAVVPLLARSPGLAKTMDAVLSEPWVELCRAIIERALARGEVQVKDLESAARVIPSMAIYRVLIQQRPVDEQFFLSLIDELLVPALTTHARNA